MSTYVLSDIHGHKSAFDEMLNLIDFTDEDELYVLGDIIDKGDESGEMLVWAVEKAPDNVHFMLGNHEDMAYSALKESNGSFWFPRECPWEKNDGYATLRQLSHVLGDEIGGEKSENWVHEKLFPWIDSLDVYKVLDVGEKKFMLVHAGFDPWMFENVPDDEKWPDDTCDGNWDYYARRQMLDVPYGFGMQHTQNMLWERLAWHIDKHDAPLETVFGHTYFRAEVVEIYNEQYKLGISGGVGKIAHFYNKHAIDCGCAYARSNPAGCRAGAYSLGCLCLDDMEEFYVPIAAVDEDEGEDDERSW